MEITLDDYFSSCKKAREGNKGGGLSRLRKISNEEDEATTAAKSNNEEERSSAEGNPRNNRASSCRTTHEGEASPKRIKTEGQSSGSGEQPGGRLDGMSIVVTGTFSSNSRSDVENMVKMLGGRLTSAVSGKTSYLIAGSMLEDGRGIHEGSKYKNAVSRGIRVLSEDEFMQMYDSFKSKEERGQAKKNSTSANRSLQNKDGRSSGTLWTSKYRPNEIEDVLGNGEMIKKLQTWLADWNSVVIKGNKKAAPKPAFSPGSRFPQVENINARAALISGPPGIGKSTVANLVARRCGYIPIEMNASDDRTKEIIENLSESAIGGFSLSEFAKKRDGDKGTGFCHHGLNTNMLLIMDEMDGLGAGDRGGAAALGRLIQKTRWPIICICNDRMNEKVRNLAPKCYDLKFSRPAKNQIAKRIQAIASEEGMDVEPNAIELLCESVGNDLRQILNELQLLSLTNNNIKFTDVRREALGSIKDVQVTLDVFSAAKKLLNSSESSHLTLNDRLDLFFTDFDLMPLLLEENYITAISVRSGNNSNSSGTGNTKLTLDCANSFVESDIYNSKLRTDNEWSLLQDIALLNSWLSTTAGGSNMFLARPEFPKWLGRNSNKSKNKRLLGELASVIAVGTGGNSSSSKVLRTSGYLDLLYYRATEPLLDKKADMRDAIEKSISIMSEYCLNRNHLTEHISSLMLKSQVRAYDQVDSKVKSAMTRMINSTTRALRYSVQSSKKSRRADESYGEGEFTELSDEDEGDDTKSTKDNSDLGSLIRVLKKPKSKSGVESSDPNPTSKSVKNRGGDAKASDKSTPKPRKRR